MTFTGRQKNKPVSTNLNKHVQQIPLLVNGQCVYLFNNAHPSNEICRFTLLAENDTNSTIGLDVEFNNSGVVVTNRSVREVYIDPSNNTGLIDKKGAYYWLSVDYQNQRLIAGIGEARMENHTYKYQFTQDYKGFLEKLSYIDTGSHMVHSIRLLRDPITSVVPLLVKDKNELTMNDIAGNKHLPKSHLSTVGQQLYESVCGKRFVLNDADFPDFSKAIEYSIATKGMWCNTTLQNKSTEFNPDDPNILETYLRITLNENNGESPGIPYVMEIWPVGHYSPVHNHSNANAVIRVLHGAINVSLYSFLCEDASGIEPFGKVDFVKDDITWISANLNQTHKLTNLPENKDTCITIQCYMYDDTDLKHYDYFDYLDNNGVKQQYDPDSDMDFVSFKNKMKEEWNARPSILNNMNKCVW